MLPTARNTGLLLSDADGTYEPGSAAGVAGVPFSGLGTLNMGCQFSGLGGYVDIPGAGLDLIGPVTVMAWAKADPANGIFQTIAGKGDTSYRLDMDWNGYPRFADGPANPDVVGPNRIDDGQWHFLTGTYDGSSTSFLYVDGLLAATAGATQTVPGNSSDIWIGGAPDYGNARLFDGLVDEVAIFPYALDAGQVQQVFRSAFYTSPPPDNHYDVQVQPGWNVIANQLSRGGNTLGEVLPSAPPGSVFFQWDSSSQSYNYSSIDPDSRAWDNPTLSLAPGEGGFLHNPDPSQFTITIVGEIVTPQLPLSLPYDKLALVARQIPAPATYEQITGLPPTEGTKLYRYDSVLQGFPSALSNWQAYTFSQGQWAPANPSVGVGEPVFIQIPTPQNSPAIAPIDPIIIHQGEFVRDVIAASDPDGNHITYSIEASGLQGVQINSTNGLLTWDSTTVTPATYPLTVDVADDGLPVLHARQTFVVIVVPPLRIRELTQSNGDLQVTWDSIPGREYIVQSAPDLNNRPADWSYRETAVAESESTTWTRLVASETPNAFYVVGVVAMQDGVRPDPKDNLDKFTEDCRLCNSDSYLLWLLQKLNKEKDDDFRAHPPLGGPKSAELWPRIVALMDELTKKRRWTLSKSGQTINDPAGNPHSVRAGK